MQFSCQPEPGWEVENVPFILVWFGWKQRSYCASCLVQVDNWTALGIATGTIKKRKPKAMDTRFYWIWDRKNQDQFNTNWKPGSTNRGYYFTKHFPPAHHSTVHPSYVHVANNGKCSTLQGCVNLTLSANHPVHPCAPTKYSVYAYKQNCARIHREFPEDVHAHTKQRTITPNFSYQWFRHSETQNTS